MDVTVAKAASNMPNAAGYVKEKIGNVPWKTTECDQPSCLDERVAGG